MQVKLFNWTEKKGWKYPSEDWAKDSQLVLYFFSPSSIKAGSHYDDLRSQFPNAIIMGCSTGGEIYNDDVWDDSVVAAAVHLERTEIKAAEVDINDHGGDSLKAGEALAAQLEGAGLNNVFVLSDGLQVNGSNLVKGLVSKLGKNIIVTGGLAGDGADFNQTFISLNHAPASGKIAAVGFYGDAIRATQGSVGGWEPFGPDRVVTKSKDNVLFEMDGQPALALYKKYLGDEADNLPASGLLFPITIRPSADSEHKVVRTIIDVSEEDQSMTFAGDVPEGYTARLMRAGFDNLVEGAGKAAESSKNSLIGQNSLAILISCIGRKLLLGQRISDETEIVADLLNDTPSTGFYSYGEISHHEFTGDCELHNQTMTITVLSEES